MKEIQYEIVKEIAVLSASDSGYTNALLDMNHMENEIADGEAETLEINEKEKEKRTDLCL